jgi:hypothetical protein
MSQAGTPTVTSPTNSPLTFDQHSVIHLNAAFVLVFNFAQLLSHKMRKQVGLTKAGVGWAVQLE